MDLALRPRRSRPPGTAALFAAALVVVGLALLTSPLAPLFDPDEGYYPATARESLAHRPFWDLRFNDAPRWDKPPLAYALIEGAITVFGPSTTAARVPSALQAGALLLIVGLLAARLAGPRVGLLASLVLGSSLGIGVFARVAHPEIAVVLSIATTELLICVRLAEPRQRPAWRLAVAAGCAIGYGILAKGPVAVALPALALLATLPAVGANRLPVRPLLIETSLAGTIALLLSAPWYVAMTSRHGSVFLITSLWQHNVVRYATRSYGHAHGPLYFLVPAATLTFPWTALLPGAVRRALRRPRLPRQLLAAGMLAAAATALVFYSLSASKLLNYALVLVPPLSILVALALDDLWDEPPRFGGWQAGSAALLGSLALLLLAGPHVAGRVWSTREILGGTPSSSLSTAGLWRLTLPAAVLLAAAACTVAVGRRTQAVAALVTAGALTPVLLLAPAAPLLRQLYPWARFGQVIAEAPAPVFLVGYRAPSLTFYGGRPVSQVGDDEISAVLAGLDDAWVVMDQTTWSRHADDRVLAAATVPCGEGGRMLLLRFGQARACPHVR